MSTIRVVNIQHSDATEPNIVLEADGTTVFASGITISGGTNLTVSGTAEFASGTVSAPGITFIDDNNTGIYEPAADTVAITTAATERLRVDNSGNVAIGGTTITDSNLLNIQGSGATKNIGIVLNDTNTSKIFGIQNGGSSLKFFDYTASAERMRIDSSGNIKLTFPDGNNGLRNKIAFTTESPYQDETAYIAANRTATSFAPTDLIFATGTTAGVSEKMRIDSSGRLLVGTTTEGYEAYADNLTIADSGDCGMTIRSGTSNQGNIYFSDGTSGSDEYEGIIQYLHNDEAMAFGVNNGTERMRIDSSGRVLIGTTTEGVGDASDLTIANSTRAGLTLRSASTEFGTIAFSDATSGTGEYDGVIGYEHTNQAMRFSTASAERVRIDSSGRLLVGTSSSLSTLGFEPNFQVEGTGAATSSGSFLRTSNDNNPSYLGLCKKRGAGGNVSNGDNIGRLMFMGFDGVNFIEAASIDGFVDGVVNTQNDMPARLVFSTTQDGSNSPTERMRIDDEGIIYHNSSNHGLSTSLTQSAGTIKYAFRAHHSGTAGSYGGTICFNVWSNGNVENTNNSYGPISSDERLKQDIVDVGSQWDDIKGIRLTKFRYKNNPTGELQLGPIAQELEQVCPNLITRRPASEEEIADTSNELVEGDDVLSFKASILYMKAVKALQEAMERIEQLEAKVAALEAS